MKLCFRALAMLFLTFALTMPATASSSVSADIVLTNGRFYTADRENLWVSTVAIRGERIVQVGEGSEKLIGANTRVYDLGNRVVLPGLIDSHTHPGLVAQSSRTILLDAGHNEADLMQSIEHMVAAHPDAEQFIAGYWPNSHFAETGPLKESLDVIEADRPVLIYDSLGHSIWANSKALELAGVNRDTPDIVPGFSFYQKDDHGEPTGWVTESAASVFVNHFLEVDAEIESALLQYLRYFRSQGVLTILDAGNFGMDRETIAAIVKLDRAGLLPVRFYGSYTLFKPQDLDNAVETLKGLARDFNSENIRIDTLKLFYDGVVDTRTAAMSYDYLDTPGNSGDVLLSREQVHQLILELDAAELNLHAHAVGDRAISTLLDGVGDAHASLGRKPRSRITICHVEFVQEADFARFAKYGVFANITPHWAVYDQEVMDWYEQAVGDDRNRMQRVQPLLDAGATVTFSSDNTDEFEYLSARDGSSPYTGIQVGHTRQDIGDGPDDRILPPASDLIDRKDLVQGYTLNAALQMGRSSDLGSIAAGKRADLVILNQNIFEVDKYDIHKTKPVAVMMNGKIVHGALE